MASVQSTARAFLLMVSVFLFIPASAWALDAPTITATAKCPNQINLQWSAVPNPGWGYKVEIQSDSDSRYSTWTELPITKNGRNYLPYWVTEPHYKDVIDGSGISTGSAAQFQMYGLKYGTVYNFRVRCYGETDAGGETYGSYSATASATTTTPSTIRYVISGGAGSQNGTSWANAWPKISSANAVSAGTLVLVRSGNYASDTFNPSNSGSQGNLIIIQAEPVAGTTVAVTSSSGTQVLDTNYVMLDGINFDFGLTSDNKVTITGSRNALVNLEVDAQAIGGSGVFTQGAYNLIHYCYLHDAGVVGEGDSGYVCTQWNTGANYNVVQYTNLRRGGHDTGLTLKGASYNQWKNNLHDGGWGLGWEDVDTPVCHHNLQEGSIFKDVRTDPNHTVMTKPGIELSGQYTTVRRCLIYDGYAGASGNAQGIQIAELVGVGGVNNLIYSNTIVHMGGPGIEFVIAASGNIIKNNIIYDDGVGAYLGGPTHLTHIWSSNTNCDNNTIDNNVILDRTAAGADNPGATIISKDDGNRVTLAYADANYAAYGTNFEYSPDFIDYAGRELHLKSTSLLINQGVSVVDSTWGTIGYSGSAPDLGAFEYFSISSQTCSQLGGSCCSSGQTCQGGSFQSSSDCSSLCCVGGTCQNPPQCGDGTCSPGETCPADNCCNGQTYNRGTQVCCSGTVYTGNCCSSSDCTSPQTCTNHVCTSPPTCTDTDGDGYGSPASSSCSYPQLDCNDSNINIHLGAQETCGDGIDYDCDGLDSNGYNLGSQCGGGNLALNKPVTASRQDWSTQASWMVNGLWDVQDGYWAAQGVPNWLTVDLGSDYPINRISIGPFGRSGTTCYYENAWNLKYRNSTDSVWRDFTGVTKLNGSGTLSGPGISVTNGQPASSACNNSYKFYNFTFTPVNARYVRYEVTQGDSGGDTNGDEIEVYGGGSGTIACSGLYSTACQSCHKSDSNCDSCVDMNELNAFIDRWKINNQDVTIRELIEAIGEWKSETGC